MEAVCSSIPCFIMQLSLLPIFIFIIPPSSDALAARDMGLENELIHKLLSNYSKFGRPIADVSKPIHVTLSFYLTQLMSLEEKHQILTTFGWLETHWRDEYLVWNETEYKDLQQLVLSPELVWLPDFGIENSAKSIYDELFFKRFRVSVSHNGSVNWVPGGKFVTSCQLDITYYPFDDQECHIDLVDWAYHGLQVKLTNSSAVVGLDAFKESGEWTIIKTVAESSDQYYASDPGVPFPRVRFTLYLRRKPMFYTINIITPCITMSLLALLVFYLPPNSGEKVSLGITVLLSFSVFLLLVAENIPKTSEYVPLLGIYLTLIMSMTATSILIVVVVLNVHNRDPSAPVPKWLRHLAHDVMAPMVCMRSAAKPKTVYKMCEFTREYAHCMSSRCRDQDGVMPSLDESRLCEQISCLMLQGQGRKGPLLEEVVKHLRHITDKLREKDEEDTLKGEWETVAKILDRFFLMMFVFVVVISSVTLLLLYPMTSKKLDSVD